MKLENRMIIPTILSSPKTQSSLLILLVLMVSYVWAQNDIRVKFPNSRPQNGNFNRPAPGEILDVSPPGFCWWRAADRGKVVYRVRIRDSKGKEIHASGNLEDPVYIPEVTLRAGTYSWTVEALSSDNVVRDVRPASTFSIVEHARELPWVTPKVLLSRVPNEHPRLLFLNSQLSGMRATLTTTRKRAFDDLRKIADEGLKLDLMKKPDFDKYGRSQFATLRTAYRDSYREFQRIYNGYVVQMALLYTLTGEKKYGEAAKAHLLNLLDWPLEGVTSVQDPRFDELGLNIAHTAPQTYDWCYDLLSEEERNAIEEMLVARGNLLLARMQRRDFLNTSGESHDGRVPGYLLEFSLALSHRPEAAAWLEYGLKAMLTVFPHWADSDGGWAEGVDYALSYNDRFLSPLQSLYLGTGYDLWQKSFFRKFPYFLIYCLSPRGEISPFGDMEHIGIGNRADKLCSILYFYAQRYKDPVIQWWVDLFGKEQLKSDDGQAVVHRLILADAISSIIPKNIALDKSFSGIGWSAMHTNISDPSDDILVLFKCSPFGQDSHSHADQNSFAIMKGGRALALPSGARFPQQGSPFHTKYTIQTIAHNALLVNGNGQIEKDESATGQLTAFKSLPHIAYAAGEAQKCYGPPVTRYTRHIVLIRPSVVLIVDDLAASESVQVDWLMHGKEQFELNQKNQAFISSRNGAFMKVNLLTPAGMDFHQDDLWPVDPKEGYPMVTEEPPAKQWHFSAKVREKSQSIKIAAIMSIGEGSEQPEIDIKHGAANKIEINARFKDIGQTKIMVDLSSNEKTKKGKEPFIEVRYTPQKGKIDLLSIPRQ
ncbi:MAG: DUF4962 domain-containing protein [bacterium]